MVWAGLDRDNLDGMVGDEIYLGIPLHVFAENSLRPLVWLRNIACRNGRVDPLIGKLKEGIALPVVLPGFEPI